MPSVSSHNIHSFYQKLPPAQQAFIQDFHQSHHQKQINVDGTPWQYYVSNSQEDVLLLLHGGFTDFSMWIHQIVAFEKQFRVIAPTCPNLLQATMNDYSQGIRAILKAEKAEKVNLMGYSEGGLIAQCFLRENKDTVDKAVLAHTFYPSSENKYYQYNFNLFRVLPASITEWLFRAIAKPDKEELNHDSTEWLAWYKAYFNELKSTLTKEKIITHIDLMIDFSRNYQFHPDDLSDWHGELLITVSEDDVVFRYFEGLKRLYPFAQTHTFDKGQGAHSLALITPEVFNHRIRNFLEN